MKDPFEVFDIENHQVKSKDLQLLNALTNRQKTIAIYLAKGIARKDIAKQLNISLQAVHQIVLRMRERFGERPFNYYQKRQDLVEFYRCLTFAGLLMKPDDLPEDMYDRWLSDTFLREYQRPPLMLIKKIYKEFNI